MTVQPSQPPRRVEYRPLSSLKRHPQNPKAHDLVTLDGSVGRFGYIGAIDVDGRTGYVISGHGRADTLTAMKDRGEEPPDGVQLADDGDWLVPVGVGWESHSDTEAVAALIALNQTTTLGGWVDEALLEHLDTLSHIDGGLVGVGFTEEDRDELRKQLEGDSSQSIYTRHSEIPHYQITGERPDPSDLVDLTKTHELQDAIDAADLPPDVREFLRLGAYRHAVFDYAKIAEFYAHADSPVQQLMEESALVIIDLDDAIRLGYVAFTDVMRTILGLDLETEGTTHGEVPTEEWDIAAHLGTEADDEG